MATFQKIETVEAKQYSGPRLLVVNDALGEQVAVEGDYLLGTERGQIRVVSKVTFEKDYHLLTEPTVQPKEPEVAADLVPETPEAA